MLFKNYILYIYCIIELLYLKRSYLAEQSLQSKSNIICWLQQLNNYVHFFFWNFILKAMFR